MLIIGFIIGFCLSAIIELILQLRKFKKFFDIPITSGVQTTNFFDAKTHFDYAVEIAPAYDYFLYLNCPFKNEFNSPQECKVWNCPASFKCTNLTCKGLKCNSCISDKEYTDLMSLEYEHYEENKNA